MYALLLLFLLYSLCLLTSIAIITSFINDAAISYQFFCLFFPCDRYRYHYSFRQYNITHYNYTFFHLSVVVVAIIVIIVNFLSLCLLLLLSIYHIILQTTKAKSQTYIKQTSLHGFDFLVIMIVFIYY